MAARSRRTELGKALRLACRKAEGVRGTKLELKHFLNQRGVDVCLLNETFFNPGKDIRLANYVCHRPDRMTAGGGTPILVRRRIVHQSSPVQGLTPLETSAIRHVGRQKGENSCGLPFAIPPTDRGGPGRVSRQRVTGAVGRRPEH